MVNLQEIERLFLEFSQSVPLEWYTFIGSVIEELIGIIPSPFVLTVAGSLAQTNGQPLAYLFWLAVMGSLGKTFGGWILYVIADKAEDTLIPRFGKYLGVTHSMVENIGKKFGKGRRDDFLIFIMRALPIFPGAAISVVCGAIRINMTTYLVTSFLGNYVRNMIYLYLGYSGLEQTEQILNGIESTGDVVKIIILVAMVGLLGWVYYHRSKRNQA